RATINVGRARIAAASSSVLRGFSGFVFVAMIPPDTTPWHTTYPSRWHLIEAGRVYGRVYTLANRHEPGGFLRFLAERVSAFSAEGKKSYPQNARHALTSLVSLGRLTQTHA